MPETTAEFPRLRLKKNEERRLRAGHLWVYSNEVDIAATPLKQFEPGQAIAIVAHNGKLLGTGYVNPHSLICARLVSRDPAHPLTPSLLVHRLKVALSLRERRYSEPFYRLVYGESDGLPGLVVDRYGDLCVVQITTAGMEQRKDAVLHALDKVLQPQAVLWRNDSSIRALENLASYIETAVGTAPAHVEFSENGVRFRAAPANGQKTGWFFDQRDNRRRLADYTKDCRVLDVFSYSGAWGITAAVCAASEVVCVDTSPAALDQVAEHAVLNGVDDRVSTIQGDAFEVLKNVRRDNQRFDLVILDPPALIKRKADARQGALAYRRLFEAGMRVLAKDGLLVACSCSYHFPRAEMMQTLQRTARHLDRSLQVLEQGGQGADHPLHPAIPETDYLKVFFCRVLPA